MPPLKKIFPFIGDLNPANHPEYYQTLNLLPTLSSEIEKVLERKARAVPSKNHHSGKLLPTNDTIIPEVLLGIYKRHLIESLEEQFHISGGKKPVIIVRDSCFTNHLIEESLLRIFGEMLYGRYIDIVEVDYSLGEDDSTAYDKIHQNAIILLGGSFSDAYSIDPSFYKGKLASIIRDNLAECSPEGVNQRILGICFGQQFVANILGIMHRESPTVIATIKGSAQFMPSGCVMNNLEYAPQMFQKAFDGLSDFGTNPYFTTAFTRTGHVDFNLLDSKEKLLINPIATDMLTGDIVAWGFRRFIGFQGHPEVRFQEDETLMGQVMSEIAPLLERDYGKEVHHIVDNFQTDTSGPSIENIDGAFYVFALLSMSEDILSHVKKVADKKISSVPLSPRKDYSGSFSALLALVHKRIDAIIETLEPGAMNFHHLDRKNMLEKLDLSRKLVLNSRFDWKVNRGIRESSELLGFKDISIMADALISHMKRKGNQGPYIFRDWGAGNGTLLKELYESLRGKDIIFYGVGDTIYFDLHQGLLKLHDHYPDIPEEILILFTQKVIEKYNALENDHLQGYNSSKRPQKRRGFLYSKIYHILQDIELSTEDSIFFASMFSESTTMFPRENIKPLSEESRQYISSGSQGLSVLKKKLMKQFYEFFEGFFERIYIADFSDFSLEDRELRQADIQVAIRSTSHIDSGEYIKVLTEYIENNSRKGSILFENGVHRSYSSVPRIAELHFIARNFAHENVAIHLVYDTISNYFCTAIIVKDSDIGADFFRPYLSEGKVLVPVSEAAESTFFRFEAFLRNFLVSSFRDFDVFFQFNKDIVGFLQKSIAWIESNETDKIFYETVKLVNAIVLHYQVQGKNYSLIDIHSLLLFQGANGEYMYDILNEKAVVHNWFNREGVRKN